MTSDVLENTVWHALTGPHARFAFGNGQARHYARDVAPFSAIEEPTAAAYEDLAASLPPGGEARLFRPGAEPLPAGWTQEDEYPLLQMLATTPGKRPVDAQPVVELTELDTEVMLELVAITKPGPFAARTVQMGRYVGIREGGQLIAMAGERMRVAGHVELSAICTHPDARGRGMAEHLVRNLMCDAFERGERPFLHVRPENSGAIALYRRLGFEARRELRVLLRKPDPAAD